VETGGNESEDTDKREDVDTCVAQAPNPNQECLCPPAGMLQSASLQSAEAQSYQQNCCICFVLCYRARAGDY